jgi:HTH-type transcriptional regulator / antitoxin HipB
MRYRLADIVVFHRRRSGLTQQELAELAGVGKNMVYELESGKQSVRLDNVLKVLQALNIELDFQSPLRESFLEERADAERQGLFR